MTAELHIADEWREALAAAGLDTFNALMECESGECFSRHARGRTYRIVLPSGPAVFVKHNSSTSLKDICTDLWCLRWPVAPCISEALALLRMAELDIPAPRAIAWGARRGLIAPGSAVVVMTELAGQPLDQLLSADPEESARRDGLSLAGEVAAKIHQARLSWPDLRAKHIILGDGPAGVLDLTRMRPARGAARRPMGEQISRFCAELRSLGCSSDDIETFLNAFALAPPHLRQELLGENTA